MSVSEKLNPDRNPKVARGLKAERTFHRVTMNPSSASPGETLYVTVPKLSEGVLLVPGSLALRFDLNVAAPKHANNRFVNNIGRNLVTRRKVTFAGETLQDTNRYDLLKTYEDLYLLKTDRESRFEQGIQTEAVHKLRAEAGDKATSDAKNNAVNAAYGKKYIIPLDHELLDDHGVLYPRALAEAIVFELTLATASELVVGSDATKLNFSLVNLELEYESIRDDKLAQDAIATYQNGKAFVYEHMTLHKTFSIAKNTDSIINQSVNLPRRSMNGLLLLFVEPYTAGARDSEKFVNPDITSVRVTVDGMPNKVYSQGLKPYDFWKEAQRRFGAAKTLHREARDTIMSPSSFYGDNKFALWIDLRTCDDQEIHGGGLRLVNTRDGVQLEIKRTTSGSGTINCHVFVVADAQLNLLNSQLESIQY